MPPSNHEKLREYYNSKLPTEASFEIPLLSNDKVLKYLQGVDIRKSTGTDDIGPRLLKTAASYIADSLTYTCTLSIKIGTFPEKWKEAKVIPLHKSGLTNDVNNFRSISILPVVSKIIEKHTHDTLLSFLESTKLLHSTQSGFRPNHSCETALVYMTGNWLKALDKGDMVGVLFVDFCKAFDLVDHAILQKKMDIYKIHPTSLNWFNSYLKSRKQNVSFNNTMSDQEHTR